MDQEAPRSRARHQGGPGAAQDRGSGRDRATLRPLQGLRESPDPQADHLLDEEGAIISQVDRWPAGLPSNIWVKGQVIVDEYELEIPPDVQSGQYQIAVGLYNANAGTRFQVVNQDGEIVADDRVILPLVVGIEP